MAGNTQAVAVQSYIDPIRRALSCITKHVIQVGGGYSVATNPHVLTLGEKPVKLAGSRKLSLVIDQNYEIVKADGKRGPWKVHTLAYRYVLCVQDEPFVAYHYHPGTSRIRFPHFHHYGSKTPDAHFPTRRISIEEVIVLAIDEFGAKPLKSTWRRIVNETLRNFVDYRTWQ